MGTNNSSSSIGTTRVRQFSSNSQQNEMNVVGGRWTLATPVCRCKLYCVLRIAKTPKNYGRTFWGCTNYKVFGNFLSISMHLVLKHKGLT